MRKSIQIFILILLMCGSISIGKAVARSKSAHDGISTSSDSNATEWRFGNDQLKVRDDPIVSTLGTAYYVDNAGQSGCRNDPAYGSESNPWCTISYAISRISAGDTIIVKAGMYNENLYISGLVGTDQEGTVIKAYPGHEVILQGNGINTGRIKITGSSYLTFEGFKITNYNQGIFIEGGSDHITVRGCTIFGIGQEGLHIRENCSYINIESNTIYDTDRYIHNGEGIYIGTGSSGPKDNTHHITVRNNLIHDVGDEAIELKPGTHDCIIEGNMIYNAVVGRTWGAIEVGESVQGAQEWASNPNHVVRNNIVHDVMTGIRAGTGSLIYNNVIYDVEAYGIYINNRANDSYLRGIYHNTVDAGTSNAIHTAAGLADIRNNIGPSTAQNTPANSSYFVNTSEAAEDYHLVSDGAPVDAGVDITDVVETDIEGTLRPYGLAPDVGAYEYAPASPIVGDVNRDGHVNLQDVQACIDHVLGNQDWGTSADVNHDGEINILDVQQVVNIASDSFE